MDAPPPPFSREEEPKRAGIGWARHGGLNRLETVSGVSLGVMTFFPECTLEESQLLPVKDFLAKALSRQLRGDSSHYDVIVEQLGTRSDEEMCWKILIGLCSCVSHLTSNADSFRELLSTVLHYNWTGNARISAAYLNLMICLVSSNATFLIPCLDFLVKSFHVEAADTAAAAAAGDAASGSALDDSNSVSSGALSSEPNQRCQQIHYTLNSIIRLAPAGLAELFPMLAKRFPHKRFSLTRLAGYVQHLLRICDYLPVLQPKIFDLIVLKCLELDVEIVIEDSGEVKISEERGCMDQGDDGMFLLDEEPDMDSSRNYINRTAAMGAQSSGGEASHHRIPPEVAELADKLDVLLSLLVQFIDHTRGSGEAEERLFHQLLNAFEERVLATFKSKFVQFVLFYFTSRSERFACAFAGRLLRCFEDAASSPLKQQSAVLYLGSFLARATFLPQAVVGDTVVALLHWCSNYISSVRGDSPVSSTFATTLASQPPTTGSPDSRSYMAALLSKPSSSPSTSSGGTSRASNGTATSSASGQAVDPLSTLSSSSSPSVAAVCNWSPPQRRRADVTQHETFYYSMQAIMYIYCFHGTELASAHQRNNGYRLGRGSTTLLQLERCVSCSLDPLRFCLASVRLEFLRLSLHTGLLSPLCLGSIAGDLVPGAVAAAEPIGGAPKPVPIRMLLGGTRRAAPRSLAEGPNPLDTFFPFDPCLLRFVH